MLCDDCHGQGVLATAAGPRPCAECGGSGVLHCCEGLQAQPEADADGGSPTDRRGSEGQAPAGPRSSP
ncbi:MAG: hypothetical protein L0Z62_28450 [Gemmataceae bacterium]|nr:hypothetical protein [Gemmataceae bacterium]